MNDRTLYNAQKNNYRRTETRTATEHQRNVIKETCKNIARKHKLDDIK